jgi:phytoene desaturase
MIKYLDKSDDLFHNTANFIIKNNFDSIFRIHYYINAVNPTHIPVLFRSFWQEVKRNFTAKEAQQIISLVAFFLGRTPFDTMALYTLLS